MSVWVPSIRVARAASHPALKSNFPAFRSAATQTPMLSARTGDKLRAISEVTDRRNSRMESRIRRKVYVRFGEGDTPYLQGSTVPTLLTDRIRLWKEGVRDRVMELCCALHNFRVRLAPWQPMV